MSSEIVTVCLDGADGRDYSTALAAALARFDEDSDDPRWMQSYEITPGPVGLPLLDEYATDPRALIVDGLCAGAPRGLLDMDTARVRAAAEASRLWDQWQQFAAAYPKARSLEEFYSDSAADPSFYDSERAAADYAVQPAVMATPFLADGRPPTGAPPSLELDPVGWFGLGREAYADRRAARALPTDGLLTREGEWLDPDQPRRGASPAEKMINRFRDRLAYFTRADAYLRGLPSGCFVVRVKVRT